MGNGAQKHDTMLQKVHDAVASIVDLGIQDYREYIVEHGIVGKSSWTDSGLGSRLCYLVLSELKRIGVAISDDYDIVISPIVLFPTDLLHLLADRELALYQNNGYSNIGVQAKGVWKKLGLSKEDLGWYLDHEEVDTKTILLTAKSTKNLWNRFSNGGSFLIFGKGTSNKMMDLSSRKVLDGEDVDMIADEIAIQLGGNFNYPIEDALFLLDGTNEKGSVNVHKAQGGRLALHATGYLNNGSIRCILY